MCIYIYVCIYICMCIYIYGAALTSPPPVGGLNRVYLEAGTRVLKLLDMLPRRYAVVTSRTRWMTFQTMNLLLLHMNLSIDHIN